jgi:hypothetical protein
MQIVITDSKQRDSEVISIDFGVQPVWLERFVEVLRKADFDVHVFDRIKTEIMAVE